VPEKKQPMLSLMEKRCGCPEEPIVTLLLVVAEATGISLAEGAKLDLGVGAVLNGTNARED